MRTRPRLDNGLPNRLPGALLKAPLTPGGDFPDANDVSLRYLIGRREDKTEMLTLLTACVFQMLPEGIALTFLHGPNAQPRDNDSLVQQKPAPPWQRGVVLWPRNHLDYLIVYEGP